MIAVMFWNALNSFGSVAALASALGIGIPALVKANNAEDGTCGNGKCSEEKWSLEEVMYMSDITKDMSETLKNLAKTNYYLSEHSIKRY